VIRLEPTREQAELHGGSMRTVSAIVRKKFISEMDLLRLRKALLLCRLAADSTELVDKRKPGGTPYLRRSLAAPVDIRAGRWHSAPIV